MLRPHSGDGVRHITLYSCGRQFGVSITLALAGGELGEEELAAWVRERWVEAEG